MERDASAGPPPKPLEPDDATPEEDAEDLPDEPGLLPDSGHVIEEKTLDDPALERRGERGGER